MSTALQAYSDADWKLYVQKELSHPEAYPIQVRIAMFRHSRKESF
jgi:hypothetical protein